MLPELKKIRTENNDIDSLIDALIMIKAEHGNIPVFDNDYTGLDLFTVYVGKNNYAPEEHPNGYIVLT